MEKEAEATKKIIQRKSEEQKKPKIAEADWLIRILNSNFHIHDVQVFFCHTVAVDAALDFVLHVRCGCGLESIHLGASILMITCHFVNVY